MLSPTTKFSVNGMEFQAQRLDAMKQFHIARRVAPILSEFLPVIQKMNQSKLDGEGMTEEEKFDRMLPILKPLIDGIMKLSDADSEFVIHALLTGVEIKQSGGNWARLSVGGLISVPLDLPTMLQVAGQAFMWNLGGFINASRQS